MKTNVPGPIPISRLLFDDFTPLGVAAGAVAGMVAYFCVEAR